MIPSNIPRADFSVHNAVELDDLVGNQRAKETVRRVMCHPGVPPKKFLAGPAGSGKSSIVDCDCKLVACHHPRGDRPCGDATAVDTSSRDTATQDSLSWVGSLDSPRSTICR